MKSGSRDVQRDPGGYVRPRRVLVVATAFPPAVRAGGPARSIANLVADTADSHLVYVIAPDRDLGCKEAFVGLSESVVRFGGARVRYVNVGSTRALLRALTLGQGPPWDLVLLNSFWNVRLSFVPALLKLTGFLDTRRLVLMPRGELDAGAIRIKAAKKALALRAFEVVYGRAIDAFGATSEHEVTRISALFPGSQVLLTDNSPDPVPYGEPAGQGEFALRLLFLGRVNEKKGLLEALHALRFAHQPIALTIAGPVDGAEYWHACRSEMQGLPPFVKVAYVGAVEREAVPGLLHKHDALLALTAGENFGHSIAESLQAGCPVLATAHTPWTTSLERGGGWVAADSSDAHAVAELLDRIAGMSESERLDKRRKARDAYEAWARQKRSNIIDQALAEVRSGPREGIRPRPPRRQRDSVANL